MTPNPGSREAVRAGCICPEMDNHRGRGRGTDPDTDERLFWFTSGCPVHAPRTGTNAPAYKWSENAWTAGGC